MRVGYGNRAYWFLVVYSLVILVLLLLQGFGIYGFSLPDNAVLALVGSTAVSAVGLFHGVINGLFKTPGRTGN